MSNYNKGFFLSTLLNTVCLCRTFTAALTLFKTIFKCVQGPTSFVTSSTQLISLELRLFLNTIKDKISFGSQPDWAHPNVLEPVYSIIVSVTLLESCAKIFLISLKNYAEISFCHMCLCLPNRGCRPQDMLLVSSPPVCW